MDDAATGKLSIREVGSTKIFEANIFMIHEALPKFTKILSHENLEPYGICIASWIDLA